MRRPLVAIVFAAIVALAAAAPHAHTVHAADMTFAQFKTQFNKVYASADEEAMRATVFAKKLAFIAEHNADPTNTYTVGITQFADLTSAEFKAMHLAKIPQPDTQKAKHSDLLAPVDISSLPNSLDWRTKKVVTPIKLQGQCGSCWAFSATGAMEAAYAIATGKLVSLSEQQLMDCSSSYGNDGCCGGLMDNAYAYIIKNGGLDTEADYPYTAADGTCNTAKEKKHAATIFNFTDVASTENAFLAALNIAPLAMAIDASSQGFDSYTGGVYSGPCGTQVSHSMLVVGYTPDYWIVKNQWGTTWGDQGYMYMTRKPTSASGGASGICGFYLSGSYVSSMGKGENEVAQPGAVAAGTHYGNPANGCLSDEMKMTVTGVPGSFCSPSCSPTANCPTDVPTGTTARPACVLELPGSSNPCNCALLCTSGSDSGCPKGASCQVMSGSTGFCTYQ